MKRRVVLICVVLMSAGMFSAQEAKERWAEAQAAYTSGDYAVAVAAFQDILNVSPGSVPAMYNLGNSYLQQGDLGRAILWYERALKLKPRDPDVRQNLAIANARRENAMIAIRPFFLIRWIDGISGILSGAWWGIWTMIFLWSAVGVYAGILLHYLPSEVKWIGWAAGILFILCLFFSTHRYRQVRADDTAVVVSGTAITIAPEGESKLIAQIGAGEKVAILDSLGQYYKIRLVNYEQGWIPVTVVEKI